MPTLIRPDRRSGLVGMCLWKIRNITRGTVKINMGNKNVRSIYALTKIRKISERNNTHPSSSLGQNGELENSWKTGPPGLQNLSLSLGPSLHSTYHNSSHHHMNRSGHPSVPLQQNTLWGHAPLLCAHHEEPTEPLHKGQLKSGWWWKARHQKRKQIRPMNNHHSTVQRSLGLKAALLSFKMWRCATHPQQNQPLCPSLQPHPLLYSSPPESSVGV